MDIYGSLYLFYTAQSWCWWWFKSYNKNNYEYGTNSDGKKNLSKNDYSLGI